MDQKLGDKEGDEERLYFLLLKEERYYQAIWELCRAERERLLTGEEMASLDRLIQKKQILLDGVRDLELILHPLKLKWLQGVKGRFESEIRATLVGLTELLKLILDHSAWMEASARRDCEQLRNRFYGVKGEFFGARGEH